MSHGDHGRFLLKVNAPVSHSLMERRSSACGAQKRYKPIMEYRLGADVAGTLNVKGSDGDAAARKDAEGASDIHTRDVPSSLKHDEQAPKRYSEPLALWI